MAFPDIIGDALSAYALIQTSDRSIDSIIPDVTVEEVHHDEVTITQHPVETGAPVSDHAFQNPVIVEMRVGWSDASHQSPGYVKQVYNELLGLKDRRQVFNVSTGKRQYKNMLVRHISVTTDSDSEWALNAVVILQEVIITNAGGGGDESGTPFGALGLSDLGSALLGEATSALGLAPLLDVLAATSTGPVGVIGSVVDLVTGGFDVGF
jgi:hypothetical protein